ncbi:MAG: preprotein translocase subunit YajC, partial [Pseudomonadota bacterium]
VTAGGLIGKVAKVADDDVEIDLAEGVRVKAVKSTISDVRTKTEPAEEKKSDKK